jgi:poly [ADP-ribose] polymerase
VDEYCPLANYQVYIAPDGTIYDASLNQTNSSANNSKQHVAISFT